MPDKRIATTADGTHIAYQIWGGPSATHRVALIHALAMTSDFWSATAARLTPECEVLAIDCRGHGSSEKPGGPYTVDLFAQDLASVLDDCGWDSCIVGGASMGGCVAQAFADQFADRTSGLALIDTTAWYGETAPQDWETRAQKARDGGLAAMVDFQKTRWFSDGFRRDHPEKVEKPVKVFLANDVAAYVETCRMLGQCDLRDALGRMTMPVEILVGEEDFATPISMATAMKEGIAGSKLTRLPGVRHLTPLEVPDEVAQTVRRVIARL